MLIDHDALKELDNVHELIDWSHLERLLLDIHSRPKGEKAWPPLMMFKALILQSWYKLSDLGLEKQLAAQGLYIKSGELSIVDASVIEAKQCRPNKGKDGQMTQGPQAA